MHSTYAQTQKTAQKKEASTAAAVLDASSQNEGLQRKADMANGAAQREEVPRPNNTGMPDNLKSGIESLSGFSMDDVRVHYNSSKPATVQALAYTQGTDIHVAPGQEKHLPHEAWHVAQQMAGRVSPTTNINGMPVNDNTALEHEADVMGEKAVQMKSDESKTVQRATTWNGVAQRVELNNYYYHISPDGIPKFQQINPMFNNNPEARAVRGDDLGPGFYMGDFNFLKYYYGKNYFDSEDLFIYYIEKELIDKTLGSDHLKDFTQKKELDDLFDIAMQLGFRYTDENNVDNHQRPLDLLAEEKTENLDEQKKKELDEQKMKKFEECVKKICGDKDVKKINDFFTEAKKKAIWKGYINDIDNCQIKISIQPQEIIDFFHNEKIGGGEHPKEEIIVKELASTLPLEFNSDTDNFTSFRKKATNLINVKIQRLKLGDRYENFLERKKRYTFNYLKQGDNPLLQIAIRQNVENVGPVVNLLAEIKQNVIRFTKKEIVQNKLEFEENESKVGKEFKTQLMPVLVAERNAALKREAEKEKSKAVLAGEK